MSITILLYFIVGLTLLSVGANLLVSSTNKLSIAMKMSGFLASFIFIGLATSAPEIFISILSSLSGRSQIAIGNALGSNIANISLVFAIGFFFVKSEKLLNQESNRFFIILSVLSLVSFIFLYDGMLSFIDSLIILFVFVLSILIINYEKNEDKKNNMVQDKLAMIIFTFLVGLSLLLYGSKLFLNGSISIAKYIGVSDYIIGLSITAIGTSLPELAATIESARKKKFDFIIGNILGSNIFNITIVIGVAGLITETAINQTELLRDIIVISITTLILYIIIRQNNVTIAKILTLSLLVIFILYQLNLYGVRL